MAKDFHWWVENRHQAVKEWKEKNQKPVVGYFCCMTPEEMIYALDMLPMRVSGSSDKLEIVDKHVPIYGCGCVRSTLDLAARGVYDYLDAVVIINSCDIIARCEYWWRVMVPRPKPTIAGMELAPYTYWIKYPEKIEGRKVSDYFKGELRYFKQYLERLRLTELTDDRLRQAIAVYNEHYDLMRQLHDRRRQDPPLISGYEAWEVEFASLLMPKDEHNQMMKTFLPQVARGEKRPKPATRLYLASACAMDPEGAQLYKMIEECGGQVVSEDISWGTSYHWTKIDTTLPPLEAIVKHRLDIHCPRSTVDYIDYTPGHRWEYIKETMAGYHVKGVVFYNLGYCECRASETPHLRDLFKEEYNLPVLFLEGDYTREGLEQMRGHIEAFIEMLEE